MKPVAIIFLALVLSACSMQAVQPWEKELLAHPAMQRGGDAHQSALEQHTYRSKEATQGSINIGAGGCGCN